MFCYKHLSSEEIKAYTNLSKEAFDVLCQYLRRFEPYNHCSNFTVKSISHEDQLLICLMKLKLNLRFFDIGRRCSVSRATVHNIYMTYLHLLCEVLFMGILNKIPSIEKNPDSFGDFSNCRIIIDCTEFAIEKPRTDLNTAGLLYSNYKHNLTVKYLFGVAPNGSITFISDGYLGCVSDKMVTDFH